jgi:type IV secretion system protein VirB6
LVIGLLTVFVAVLGYRIMLGYRAPSLSSIPIVGLKIGTVLALTLNWNVFQTLVLDLSARAPTELAGMIVGPKASPLERLQSAYDELQADKIAFAKLAGSDQLGEGSGAAEVADKLGYASDALLASTAGILALATVITGVMVCVGPIFVALFLFESAGGLFSGWIRALAASAIVPMLCWITVIILLAAIEPRLAELAEERGSTTLDASSATVTALIVFVFAVAQIGLVVAAVIIACGFRFPLSFSKPDVVRLESNSGMGTVLGDTRIDRLVRSLQRSSEMRDIMLSRSIESSASRVQVHVDTVQNAGPYYRPLRLGESYRRISRKMSGSIVQETRL